MKKYILFVLLVSIASVAYSQGTSGTEEVAPKPDRIIQKTSVCGETAETGAVCTVAVIVDYSNSGAGEQAFIAGMIEKELGAVKNVRVVPFAQIKDRLGGKGGGKCGNATCAREYGTKLSADFIVYGAIDKNAREFTKPLDEGEYPYLIQKIKNVKYVINVTLYDEAGEMNKAKYADKTNGDGLKNSVKKMSRAFGPFLVKRIVRETVPVKEGPAPKNEKVRPRAELSLFSAAVLPVDRLRGIINAGAGAGFTAGVSNLAIPRDLFMLSGTYVNGAYRSRGTAAFNSFDLMIYWGMYLPVAPRLKLLPLVGAGCQFSFASFDTLLLGIQKNRYIDTIIGIALEMDIELPAGFAVLLAPEYKVFFEKKTVGMYPGLRAGVKYTF